MASLSCIFAKVSAVTLLFLVVLFISLAAAPLAAEPAGSAGAFGRSL